MKKSFYEWLDSVKVKKQNKDLREDFGYFFVPCKGGCDRKVLACDMMQLCDTCFKEYLDKNVYV
jgi:hypothetical protein